MQKELKVFETSLRRINVIETFWTEYPCYYTVKNTTVVESKGKIKVAFKDDVIVWDKEGSQIVMPKIKWDNIYGKHFAEEVKNAKH